MNRVRDSIAYLLERTGDIKGAFKIILEVYINNVYINNVLLIISLSLSLSLI